MKNNYRNDFREHKIQVMDQVALLQEELTDFKKWAQSEEGAVDIVEGIKNDMLHFVENIAKDMRTAFDNSKSVVVPYFDPDTLGYPSYESTEDEYGSVTSNATIINRTNGVTDFTEPVMKIEDEEPLTSLWKGKAREVNPLERVIDMDIPLVPYVGKGKGPGVPYGASTTTYTRVVGCETLATSSTVVWESFENLVKEVNVFQESWGMGLSGAEVLKKLARAMRDQATSIQTFIGHVSPSRSARDNSTDRHLRTSGQPTTPSQNGREATPAETDPTEHNSAQYKITIPARANIQLPPKQMRKKNKHFAENRFNYKVNGQLEGEAREEEVALNFESISQAFRPVQRRTRYNLRSNARRNNVAGPSRLPEGPTPTEPKQNKKDVSKPEASKPEASKRTNKKRQVEDEDDNSHKNKKRRREDEVPKREVKKEGPNNKRKRKDENVNEEKKTRKRTKRN